MKKVATIYKSKSALTLSSVVRIKNLQVISDEVELIIFTNQQELLQSKIKARYIRIPSFNFIFGDILYFLWVTLLMAVQKVDVLYLDIKDSPISLFVNARVKIFHVYQAYNDLHGDLNGKNFLKKLFLTLRRKLIYYSLAHSDLVFCVSKQLVEIVRVNSRARNIEILPHGVDIEEFDCLKEKYNYNLDVIPSDQPVIMHTGSLNAKRGLNIMVELAVKMLERQIKAKFILVGISKYDRIIHQAITNHSVENYFVLIEPLDYSLIPALLQRATHFISILFPGTGYEVSPPQKIFEYMAAAKPIIVNDIPTHTDFIVDGEDGIVLKGENIDEYLIKIIKLFQDKNKYDIISQNLLRKRMKYDIRINKCRILASFGVQL
ncbi:hypothetical protein MASR1M107_28580 [Ignavibacteriales bacterium]